MEVIIFLAKALEESSPQYPEVYYSFSVIAWVKKLASSNFIYKRHNARTARQSPCYLTLKRTF